MLGLNNGLMFLRPAYRKLQYLSLNNIAFCISLRVHQDCEKLFLLSQCFFSYTRFCYFESSCLQCGGVTFVCHCCICGLLHTYLSVRFQVLLKIQKSVSHVSGPVHMDLDTRAFARRCPKISRAGSRGHRTLTDRCEGECSQAPKQLYTLCPPPILF